MRLPDLFHWAPTSRREQIQRNGLEILQPGVAETTGSDPDQTVYLCWPWICLATSPQRAWELSGNMDWGDAEDLWDLWQVYVSDRDEVHLQAVFGHEISEIRIHNSISSNRCWYVATRAREPFSAVEIVVKNSTKKKAHNKPPKVRKK